MTNLFGEQRLNITMLINNCNKHSLLNQIQKMIYENYFHQDTWYRQKRKNTYGVGTDTTFIHEQKIMYLRLFGGSFLISL